jgi:tetratricopeptide (TPR) repeat protein
MIRSMSLNTVKLVGLVFGLALFLNACTPKITEDVEPEKTTVVNEPEPPEALPVKPGCERFQDLTYGEEFKQDYVLYRDRIRANDFEGAFPMWKRVYENTPAADGKRWTVFGDGIRIYEHLYNKTENPEEQRQYRNTILDLYDQIVECYPEQEAYVSGRKAFDYYYKYKDLASDSLIYQKLKYTIDQMQVETPVFVINPFTALLVNLYLDDKIPMEQAQYYALLIPEITEYNIEKGENMESWEIVQNFTLPTLERFEGVEDFYDCEFYMEKYYTGVEDVIGDCNAMLKLYSKLRFGKCPEDMPELVTLLDTIYSFNCIKEDTDNPRTAAGRALQCLKEGDFKYAVKEFEIAAEEAEDPIKKADYYLIIAKIYYSSLRNFPLSRSYALKAAKVRPNWGDPYILIGKLYASSGPLCGPGTGFDSQVVTWVAIDKWNRAKRIDPSVSSEANELINLYAQYMPKKEDIFQRTLKEGDKFKVECWIQETTTIRVN